VGNVHVRDGHGRAGLAEHAPSFWLVRERQPLEADTVPEPARA
jgi:hypothetical protein